MAGCSGNCAPHELIEKQSSTLKIVMIINTLMFFIILFAAINANSNALLADSLDNLGDAITYAISIYAIRKSTQTKAKIALFKGILILIAALVVLVSIVNKIIYPVFPVYELMGIFSLAGVIANGTVLFLLWRHRTDDINMSSVYECSRNDIISNLSVFLAAGLVWLTNSALPDLIIASILVVLLLKSAFKVIKSSYQQI